jgi:hypothetical protein
MTRQGRKVDLQQRFNWNPRRPFEHLLCAFHLSCSRRQRPRYVYNPVY